MDPEYSKLPSVAVQECDEVKSPQDGKVVADFLVAAVPLIDRVEEDMHREWDTALRVAAFLGALKLAVAVVFALYLANRFNPYRRSELDHDLLDAAALLAVCATAIVALPALLEATPQLLAPHRPALWLAGLAATLSMIERFAESEQLVPVKVHAALPARRGRASALRWDYLRREAGQP